MLSLSKAAGRSGVDYTSDFEEDLHLFVFRLATPCSLPDRLNEREGRIEKTGVILTGIYQSGAPEDLIVGGFRTTKRRLHV